MNTFIKSSHDFYKNGKWLPQGSQPQVENDWFKPTNSYPLPQRSMLTFQLCPPVNPGCSFASVFVLLQSSVLNTRTILWLWCSMLKSVLYLCLKMCLNQAYKLKRKWLRNHHRWWIFYVKTYFTAMAHKTWFE